MNNTLEKLKSILGANKIKSNEPMESHTAFKFGGEAEYYLEANSQGELMLAVKTARELGLSVLVFGAGTEMIISKNGIKGLVIKNNSRKFEVLGISGTVKNQKLGVDKALVYAESGVIINQLVRYTIEEGLSGLEYQLGLPGTVGGAVYMNSGLPCKSSFVGDCLYSAKILKESGEIAEVDNMYFQFGYDRCAIRKSKDIVLSVVFRLEKGDKKVLWERATDALTYRTNSQPKEKGIGYTYRTIGLEGTFIPISDRIERACNAIKKTPFAGKKMGGVMLSSSQPNYIVHVDGATDKDVTDLVAKVKDSVFDKLGLPLYMEASIVGA